MAVAASVVLLGVAGLITTLGSAPTPEPGVAAPTRPPATARPGPAPTPIAAAPSAAPAGDAPVRAAVDPATQQAMAYLDALRTAGVPTSRNGLAETEAAALICRQMERGADKASLVRALPAVLTTITPAQAPLVVDAARTHYC
jgi:hypothetical protein